MALLAKHTCRADRARVGGSTYERGQVITCVVGSANDTALTHDARWSRTVVQAVGPKAEEVNDKARIAIAPVKRSLVAALQGVYERVSGFHADERKAWAEGLLQPVTRDRLRQLLGAIFQPVEDEVEGMDISEEAAEAFELKNEIADLKAKKAALDADYEAAVADYTQKIDEIIAAGQAEAAKLLEDAKAEADAMLEEIARKEHLASGGDEDDAPTAEEVVSLSPEAVAQRAALDDLIGLLKAGKGTKSSLLSLGAQAGLAVDDSWAAAPSGGGMSVPDLRAKLAELADPAS